MRAFKLSFVIAGSFLAVAAVNPVQGVGFTCEGPNGPIKRLNIDLKAKRFQEDGMAGAKIQEIDEAVVTLRRYYAFKDGISLWYRLDRSTLVLTYAFGDGENLRSNVYNCSMGPPFDFAAERKF